MHAHIAQAHDFVAEMAFCCSTAVGEFVGCEVGEEGFRVWRVRVAFLRDFEVAELAEDYLAGTDGCSVAG